MYNSSIVLKGNGICGKQLRHTHKSFSIFLEGINGPGGGGCLTVNTPKDLTNWTI